MAKPPAKPAAKPVAKKLKPKAVAKVEAVKALKLPPAKVAKKPAVAKAPAPAKKVAKAKPSPVEAPASGIAQFAKDTGDAISKLAADILADRIIPTIEQIKAVATHALGKDAGGKSRGKGGKNKKK